MFTLFITSVILGLVQGVTEFLPISSSGHLVVFETLFGLQAEQLGAFDIFLHFGTLLAIFIYFKDEVWQMLKELLGLTKGAFFDKLIVKIILATIPAGVVGIYAKDFIEGNFRQPFKVGGLMIITGLFFLCAERYASGKKKKTGIRSALVMGMLQIFGLFPGVSRSGSVISGGLLSGLRRQEAARFSFLMALPAIGGAALLQVLSFADQGRMAYPLIEYWWFYVFGFLASLLSSFFAIKWVLKFFNKHKLSSFSIYLFIMGGLLILFYNL